MNSAEILKDIKELQAELTTENAIRKANTAKRHRSATLLNIKELMECINFSIQSTNFQIITNFIKLEANNNNPIALEILELQETILQYMETIKKGL